MFERFEIELNRVVLVLGCQLRHLVQQLEAHLSIDSTWAIGKEMYTMILKLEILKK